MTQHTYEFFPYPESKEAKRLGKEHPEAVTCPRCRNHHLDWDNHDKLCERCCNSLLTIHTSHPSLPFIRFARVRGMSARLVDMLELSQTPVLLTGELPVTKAAALAIEAGKLQDGTMLTRSRSGNLVRVSLKEAQNLGLVEATCDEAGAVEPLDKTHWNRKGAYRLKSAST